MVPEKIQGTVSLSQIFVPFDRDMPSRWRTGVFAEVMDSSSSGLPKIDTLSFYFDLLPNNPVSLRELGHLYYWGAKLHIARISAF